MSVKQHRKMGFKIDSIVARNLVGNGVNQRSFDKPACFFHACSCTFSLYHRGTYDSGEQVTGARIASSVNSRGNDAYLVVLENQIVIFYGIIRRSLIKNTGDDDRLDLRFFRFFQRSGNPGNPVQIIRFVLILGKPCKIRVC